MQDKINKYIEECCKYCKTKNCSKAIVVEQTKTMLDGEMIDTYITKCADYTTDRKTARRAIIWQTW